MKRTTSIALLTISATLLGCESTQKAESIPATPLVPAEPSARIRLSDRLRHVMGAGVVVGAWRQVAEAYAGKRVALVICGANIAMDTLREIIS